MTNAPPERLRWIADYLDLADKAISILACVQGIPYSSDCQRGAQRDLRRWARWLEVRPSLAAGFAMARLVPEPSDMAADAPARPDQPDHVQNTDRHCSPADHPGR